MNRRTLLTSIGGLVTAGLLGRVARPSREAVDLAVWLSDDAARHPGLGGRIVDILEPALEAARISATVRMGPSPVHLDVDSGRWLLTRWWPMLSVAGRFGIGPVRPAGTVNVLVTDGDPATRPAGYGMPGIAAITGGRYLLDLPESALLSGLAAHSRPAVIAQLLLHETGHALGLAHNHGGLEITESAVIASPMIGGYAWADATTRRRRLGTDPLECAEGLENQPDRRRRLGLRYSECARRSVR